ncbi:MAG: arsenite methyltransferase [Lentimicrobiaceae bacterium]|nr:arsenite methyltransferase [Lentimicrobiaceae bacterium]
MKTKKKDLKEIVRSKYNQIAFQSKLQNQSSCCGGTPCCDQKDYAVFSEDASLLEGYATDADLGLGCGLPTEFAGIRKGDTVLDLGSGAGNDCFIARALTGEEGKVIGIDFAGAMLQKARENARKLGYTNVAFIRGDIENMPFTEPVADVVISNCVLNLVPDKKKAFSEMHRVMKPDGHFCISDVVISGDLPEKLLKEAELYAGCVSGAILREDYLHLLADTGFTDVEVRKQKEIRLPDDLLLHYLSKDELEAFKGSTMGIYSITVTGKKNS